MTQASTPHWKLRLRHVVVWRLGALCLVIWCLTVPSIGLSAIREPSKIRLSTNDDSIMISRDIKCANITVLPHWLRDYFQWHQDQRQLLTEHNWNDSDSDNQTHFKFLIYRCLHSDRRGGICGGTSDRLQSLPAKIRLAAKWNRILFILWERPSKLEEFLVPPCGGLDWRVPEWLKDHLLPLLQNETFNLHSMKDDYLQAKNQVIHTTWNMGQDLGAGWYNQQLDVAEPTFEQVYHPLWAAVFQPSKPVQEIINETLDKLHLRPNQYHALHIRSQYLNNETTTAGLVKNATNCALFSYNDSTFMPLYIATDSNTATQHATQHAVHWNKSMVAARPSTKEPLHLDRGREGFLAQYPREPDLLDNPAAYYDTFVDLYLLSLAQCITFGRGYFGRWANLISANSSCYVSYFDKPHHQYKFPPSCDLPGHATN
jgi:hypothetical protein